jgi:hypothetical protein
MTKLRLAIAALFLPLLLVACTGAGDTDLGPNPGGGFYDGQNINVGQVNP